MWLTFESIEEKKNMPARNGKTYDAWVLSGIKRGYEGSPDEPWSKVIFPQTAVAIREKGVLRRNQSLLQYLQKACKPGDTLIIKSEKDGKFWRIVSIENRNENVPTYEPLTDEQAAVLREKQEMNEKSELPSFITGHEDSTPW